MRCRVCDAETVPLWPREGDRPEWGRCLVCGSDTSSDRYDDDMVKALYANMEAHLLNTCGGIDGCVAEMRTNLDWFDRFVAMAPDRTFLDIGCADGGGLKGMGARDWEVHGFDVVAPSYFGPHVTVAAQFRADLFPRRFGAIMAREVIEHVPDWRDFLRQVHTALLPGGLFQVQTPRPCDNPEGSRYQRGHLQLHSPLALRYALERHGFTILDSKLWPGGQAWMCRRW